LRRTTRTRFDLAKHCFRWIWVGLTVVPAAVASASPQDFRSPLIASTYLVSFGGLRTGTASAPQTITVLNVSTNPVHITNIALAGDFRQTNNCPAPPAALSANDDCQIQIIFKPSTTAACSGTLTVSHDAAGRVLTVALNGTGNPGGAEIIFSHSSLRFPEQQIGTDSAPQAFTISASKAMLISDISVKGDFTIMPSSTCEKLAGPLVPDASCSVVVTFSPIASGQREGQVTITDSADGSPQIIPLTGIGSQ